MVRVWRRNLKVSPDRGLWRSVMQAPRTRSISLWSSQQILRTLARGPGKLGTQPLRVRSPPTREILTRIHAFPASRVLGGPQYPARTEADAFISRYHLPPPLLGSVYQVANGPCIRNQQNSESRHPNYLNGWPQLDFP